MRILRPIAFSLFLPLVLLGYSGRSYADFPKPREETLLNDLKILIWSQPDSDKITLKLRIHSGSAFDPKDKDGTMALLVDSMFPVGLKSFFEEDLEGSFNVRTDYDYIQVTATAKAGEFLTVLETLAPAVLNPTINKETTAILKAKRLQRINRLENNPSYLAERAAAKKLLGTFPYGRSKEGTSSSMESIDFADLIFAKQRLVTSDNATLAIIGNVKSSFAYRATRRLLGSWAKRTEKIPASFRLPGEPDSSPKMIQAIGEDFSEAHYAAAGFSRNDTEYFSSMVLERILQRRLKDLSARNGNLVNVKLRQDSHLLKGLFTMNYRARNSASPHTKVSKNLLAEVLQQSISESEFAQAKRDVVSSLNVRNYVDLWLDIDTYRLKSVRDEVKRAEAVKLSGVQNAANTLKKQPVAQAIVIYHKEDSVKQNPDPDDPRE